MDDNELRRSLETYKGLVEVSALINSITDYGQLLRAVLDVSRRVMRAEAASLFLVDHESGELTLVIAKAGDGEFEEPRISVPRGRGIAGWVLENAAPLLIPDAYADERFYREADRRTGFRTRSILCAPLRSGDSVKGVLQVLNPKEKTAFEAVDLESFVAFANLTATALEKTSALEQMRQQERVGRDLAIASEIQRELLARAMPEHMPGIEAATHNTPAANVGGDFFGFFPRRSGETYFAIGDVSGKGLPAALLMAQVLSAMEFVFEKVDSPADALAALNETIHRWVVRGMFVTSLVGRLCPRRRVVTLASAGHCPPLIAGSDAARSVHLPGALPLGILPGRTYAEQSLELAPHEALVAYTDGLTDSRDGAGRTFEDLLAGSLAGPSVSASEVLRLLLAAEKEHRGLSPRVDDLTVVVTKLK